MAYLTLNDGSIYECESFGYEGDEIGEVVFNTGMTGYQELLTDPSYVGQIVTMTYPLIGNYGVNSVDSESTKPHVKGFIVRDYCEVPSNWRCEETLAKYLKDNKIVAVHSVDTRELTRKIRNKGTMVGIITQKMPSPEQMLSLKDYKIKDAVGQVTTEAAYDLNEGGYYKVAVIDYGLKRNIITSLLKYNFALRVFPATTSAEEILSWGADGVMLTNGPGDPAENVYAIEQIKALIGKKPIFGICLGHQLLALANGGRTVKMKYGHRGSNHPVKELDTGRVFITSQNHGYVVDGDSLNGKGRVTYLNWNDKTVEGIEYPEEDAFSVQFHPEAKPGPMETNYLFERFLNMIVKSKEKENAKK